MRVGVLTGGGDCPGLNAVIRAVVRKGVKDHGFEFVGFCDGWRGPLEGLTMPLGIEQCRGILPRGGTILGSSRTNPFAVEGGVERIQKNLAAAGVEALVAIGGDGWIEFVIEACPSSDEVRIVVRDNGPGLTPLVRRHLFDPYFSGREAGRGLGLGLSKCWKIITQHRGRIEVQSGPGEGTAFSITLPVSCDGKSLLEVGLIEETTEARRHGEADMEK